MRFFKDIFVASGAVLLVILLFEMGLRATGAKYDSSFYESDPILYMALRPNAEGWEIKEGENFIKINSWGMRDGEHALVASPGAMRIALIGDSMIAADQVPLDKTMAKVLEAKLQRQIGSPSRQIEVLNFGVGGFTLAQEFLLLERKIFAFHPNKIILFLSPSSVPSCDRRVFPATIPYFIMRDGQVVLDPRNRAPAESSPEARRRHRMFGDLMNRVRLLQLIRKATQNGVSHEISKLTGTKRTRNDSIMKMWLNPPSSPDQENAWRVAEGLLIAFTEKAKDHGAELWISAIGPDIEEDPSATKREVFLNSRGLTAFNYSENRLESFAIDHGIKFIHLEPQLSEYAEQHQVSLHGFFNTKPDYGHWNEQGNAVAAELVANSILLDRPELAVDGRQTQVLSAHVRGDR